METLTTSKTLAMLKAAGLDTGKATGRVRDRKYAAITVSKMGAAVGVSAPSSTLAAKAASALIDAGREVWSPLLRCQVSSASEGAFPGGYFLVR